MNEPYKERNLAKTYFQPGNIAQGGWFTIVDICEYLRSTTP